MFGLETEVSDLRLTGSSSFAAPFVVGSATVGNWYNAWTARLGWSWDRLLFYGKGGFAIGTLETSIVDTRGFLSGKAKQDLQIGWTWGAGVEWAVVPNWSVKLEYLWVGLDNTLQVCATAPAGTPGPGTFCGVTDLKAAQTVKIGFNYLINAGPVYDRY